MPDPPLINEDVRIDGTFRDNDGNLADVAGLTVTVREPDATLVSYSGGAVVRDSVGEYHALHPAAKIGTHDFRWTSGAGRVVLEGEFYVAESLFDAPEDWQPISAAEIAAASQVDFDALGLTPRRLQTAVEVAKAWVEWATGRAMDSTLPDALMPLGREAVRQRVELAAFRGSQDSVQTAGTEGISSLSVGGLSISFRDPGRSASASSSGVPALTPWAALNETLWALMTDAMRDFWIARFAGIQEPSFAVTEPDFAWPSEAGHGVRTSDFPWEPFYFEPPGWPGWGWE